MSALMTRLRAVLLIATLTAAGCGDGGGSNDNDSPFPSRGTFTGTLSDGGAIRIDVGSIEAIEFDCDGVDVRETFSPPQPVRRDGSFDVGFSDAGRHFRVEGTFRDDDTADGTIDDEDDDCDVGFEAVRGGPTNPTRTPTPEPTGPTPTGGTPTPTLTPTSTGPTGTGGTQTLTPTPTPTSTTIVVDPDRCPVAVEVLGDAGDGRVLDSGWTGLAHNSTVISDGKLTFTVSGCDSTTRPCGVCDVGGPIANANADSGDISSQRCSNDTTIRCTDNTPCGAGTCVFFFGAPLPLSAGGIGTCVVNQVNGTVTGTANVETGAFVSTINLTSKVATAPDSAQPCPICNDATLNDGVKGGTCNGGAKNGDPCDANGESPIPTFGKTSLDCPPTSFISSLSIALAGSSGTETRTLSASSPNCQAFAAQGKKCFCPPAGTEPTRHNACEDDSVTPADERLCAPVSGSPRKGRCPFTAETYCSPVETFRGCGTNAECTVPGDTCIALNRPCYLDNGLVGGSVTAQGVADPPTNGISNPTFAALFCIPPVAQQGVNAAGGLPGLGRIELPLVTKEILSLP